MVELTIWNFLLILFLVFMNGFFTAAEFALVRVRETRIQELIEQGSRKARRVKEITKDLNRTTSSAQLGITLASLLLAIIGEEFFTHLFIEILHYFGIGTDGSDGAIFDNIAFLTVRGIGFLTGLLLLTYLHTAWGELIPKVISIQYTDKTALWVSEPMYWFMKLTSPLLTFFVSSSNSMLGWFGVDVVEETHAAEYSEDELKIIIGESIEKGEIEEYESRLIFNVLDFTDKVAKELISPRIDIKALPKTTTQQEIIKLAKSTGFSRIPIYEGTLDNMLGFVHIKDLLSLYHKPPDSDDKPRIFKIESILRPILIVHEGKDVDDILIDMQREKIQLAIVVDEYGSVEGLLSIEDIIEELIGNIHDEFDESIEHDDIQILDESVNVGGLVTIETFNKTVEGKFEETIEASDSVTLAGYVFELFGSEIPDEGEEITDGSLNYKIEKMNGNRIEIIQVTKSAEASIGNPLEDS